MNHDYPPFDDWPKEEDGHKPSDLRELLGCPFCGEGGFDLIGLKIHLQGTFCEPYNNININLGPRGR